MSVVELKLEFKDTFFEGEEPLAFVHTLAAPEGFEITGGQIYIEKRTEGNFERFSFRVDRDENDHAQLTIMEDVKQ